MIGAGLLARKAVAKGLTSKPWVKTSLAPGSQVVGEYLAKSGLQKDLDTLGFNLVGFGCTTCIGNSGPLPAEISKAINDNDLVAAAVLSGNRNFEGRVNAGRARELSRLAAAGRRLCDRRLDAGRSARRAARHRQEGQEGLPEGHLADRTARSTRSSARTSPGRCSRRNTPTCSRATRNWRKITVKGGLTYDWDTQVDLRAEPALFHRHAAARRRRSPTSSMRACSACSSTRSPPTTSRRPARSRSNSPAGQISGRPQGEAGRLQPIRHAARQPRSDDARHLRQYPHQEPDGAGRRRRRHHPLSVAASRCRSTTRRCATRPRRCRWSCSPARNTAPARRATGRRRAPILLGVRAVIAQSFERIHRSNLVGMGVVPLVFEEGTSWQTLGLKGDEQVTIRGLHGEFKPRQRLIAEIVAGRRQAQARAADLPHRYARRARLLQERRHPAIRAAPARGLTGSAHCGRIGADRCHRSRACPHGRHRRHREVSGR